MAAITGPKLGTKLDNPAIKAKVSMSGNPRIHKPKADSTAIKRNQNLALQPFFELFIELDQDFFTHIFGIWR
jgi:hypothetical protein